VTKHWFWQYTSDVIELIKASMKKRKKKFFSDWLLNDQGLAVVNIPQAFPLPFTGINFFQ